MLTVINSEWWYQGTEDGHFVYIFQIFYNKHLILSFFLKNEQNRNSNTKYYFCKSKSGKRLTSLTEMFSSRVLTTWFTFDFPAVFLG